MVERVESLKAGIWSGVVFLGINFLLCSFNEVILAQTGNQGFQNLEPFNHHWGLTLMIAGISGFLFGVTYRYIIRQDQNSHLKDGAVFAFGLTRGLVAFEAIDLTSIPDLIASGMFGVESLLCFAIARFSLDLALFYQWLTPFDGE